MHWVPGDDRQSKHIVVELGGRIDEALVTLRTSILGVLLYIVLWETLVFICIHVGTTADGSYGTTQTS